MSDRKRRALLIALIAVVLGLMGFIYASIPQDIAFEIVKNNTDLCIFNHTSLICDGSRQSNVTYYTNNTSIVLYVFAHANLASQTAGVFLYRDDILIEAQAGRPLAAPEQTWRGITAIIPKNSSYRVNFTDFHHFEWYEDQILSGRNGTLSINQTIIGGAGCTGDCSFNNISINTLLKNNTLDSYGNYIHLSAPFQNFNPTGNIFSNFDISNGYTNINTENITSFNNSNIYKTPELIRLEVSNANNNLFEIRQNESVYIILGRTYKYNDTHFDMNGANLTNCSNCGGNQNLSQVLMVGNSANNNSIENVSNINMSGKIWLGMPAKAAFNDIAITRTNQSGTTMGFDVVTVNSSGNTRAIFRITAGSTADPNTNTNLPFTAYSDTYAAPFTSIVRAVCFLCLEERLGVATLPATSPNGTLGNISFYVQNRTTSMPGFDGNGNLAARIDGNGSMYAYSLNGSSGTGNAYLCYNKNTKEIYVGNPGC